MLGEVCLKPPKLRRGRSAADLLAVAVESDYVPLAQIVGVVACARLASGLPEVAEVALGFSRVVLVVAGHRLGAALEAAPGGFVALLKFLPCALRVGLVAQGEHRAAFDATHEPGGCLIDCAGAAGDVAYRDDDLP